MTIEVKVPVLPESVEDAVIATWHKKPGDTLRRDENLLDLETDKVVLEVPSPIDGVLKEIKAEAGATVLSNDLLALIEEGAAVAPDEPEEAAAAGSDEKPASEKNESAKSEANKPAAAASPEPSADSRASADTGRLSPAARRVADRAGEDTADRVVGARRRAGADAEEEGFRVLRPGGSLQRPGRPQREGGQQHQGS